MDLMDFGQVLAGNTVALPARRIGIADLPAFQVVLHTQHVLALFIAL